MTDFSVIIPARFGASRLPGKPLLLLAGKPLISHVISRAHQCGAQGVIVATDHEQIKRIAIKSGAQVVMTRADHSSGTDRIAQVVRKLGLSRDHIIVNVQGDEPDMPPALIRQMALAIEYKFQAAICTACVPIEDPETLNDPNVVKVVRDKNDYALYFSRAALPFDRDQTQEYIAQRHLGIYAYRVRNILTFSETPSCALEQSEKLEQLRTLYRGEKIYCPNAIQAPGIGIDTVEDLQRARQAWGD